MAEFSEQKKALSPFFIAASLLSEPVLSTIRRELKRVSPDVRIETDQIRAVITQEVIKRDVIDGERFAGAVKSLARAAGKTLRHSKAGDPETTDSVEDDTPTAETPVDDPPSASPAA